MADISEKDLLNAMLAFAEMKKAESIGETNKMSLEEKCRRIVNSYLERHPDFKVFFTTEKDFQTIIKMCVEAYKKEGGAEYA